MNEAEIKAAVLRALAQVAPEIDPADIRPDVRLRDQVDIDSMDFLNFVVELHEALKVDISEADYSQIDTLDKAVTYLAARIPPAARAASRGGAQEGAT